MNTDVQKMFAEIAPTYDLLNHLTSFGLDIWWRRRAVSRLCEKRGGTFLDVAAGTGDFSTASLHVQPRHIVCVDFAPNTLLIARKKLQKRIVSLSHPVSYNLAAADAACLPFRRNLFDAVLVAFGIRNFPDRFSTFREMHRVMRPDGQLCILELSQPAVPVFARIFRWYFHRIVPAAGQFISGSRTAYRYLPESVDDFPPPQQVTRMMTDAGFRQVGAEPMTMGVVTLFTGKK